MNIAPDVFVEVFRECFGIKFMNSLQRQRLLHAAALVSKGMDRAAALSLGLPQDSPLPPVERGGVADEFIATMSVVLLSTTQGAEIRKLHAKLLLMLSGVASDASDSIAGPDGDGKPLKRDAAWWKKTFSFAEGVSSTSAGVSMSGFEVRVMH